MPLVGCDLSSLLFINPTAAGIHRSDPHCHWFMCCNADHWLDCWVEDGRNESWELNCRLPSFANIILRLMYRTEIWLFGEYTLRELPPINMNEQFPCSEYTIQQPSLQMEVHLSVVTHKCQYTPQKIYQKHFDVLRRFNTELLHITYVTYNIFIIDGPILLAWQMLSKEGFGGWSWGETQRLQNCANNSACSFLFDYRQKYSHSHLSCLNSYWCHSVYPKLLITFDELP